MKKIVRAAALALALGALVIGGYAAVTGDSLVSLRHLQETFFPQAVKAGDQAAQAALQETLDRAKEDLEDARRQALGGDVVAQELQSDTLAPRDWSEGQQISLSTGSGFLMLQGSAALAHDGAVIDVTGGAEVPSGARLDAGHRYLVGEGTRATVEILSGYAALGVQGSYEATGGSGGAVPFYDVSRTDWYYAPVGYAYGQGLFSGLEEHRFGPDEPMTRAMLMTVLYQLAGAPAHQLASADVWLSDVPADAWFAPYVRWAVAQQISSGTGDGAFDPNGRVTREQLVVVLRSFAANYQGKELSAGADLSGYSDLDQVSPWAREAMAWAVEEQIVSSTSRDVLTLSPRGDASRAQVAAMLRAFAENI